MAFQRRPYPILWCVRSDGVLLAFLYDRPAKVAAWTQITFSGTYESVTVVPKGTYDQVWLASLHTINGSSVRFVSYMDQLDIRKSLNAQVFVEAGLTFLGGQESIAAVTKATEGVITLDKWPTTGAGANLANGDNVHIAGVVGMTELNNFNYIANSVNVSAKTLKLKDITDTVVINTSGFGTWSSGGTLTHVENTFGNLGHLKGETVSVTIDGVRTEQQTVSGAGAIPALDDYYRSVSIGLYKTRRIVPMPFEDGRSLGRGKHIKGVLLGAYRTLGGRYGPMGSNGILEVKDRRRIDWAKAQDVHAWEDDEFTGVYRIMDSWMKERARIVFEQPEPLPTTITMIEPNIEVS